MKKWYVLFTAICTIALLAGCDKSKNDDKPSGGSTDTTLTGVNLVENKLTVKIGGTAITGISTVHASAYDMSEGINKYIASTPFSNNSFTVILPNTVGTEYLKLLSETVPSTVIISNENVKVNDNTYFCAVYNGNEVGQFLCDNYDYSREEDRVGDADVIFIYSTDDCQVSGYQYDDGDDWKFIYNLSLKKGWNACAFVVSKVEGSEVSEFQFTTNIPNTVKWYYEPSTSFASKKMITPKKGIFRASR